MFRRILSVVSTPVYNFCKFKFVQPLEQIPKLFTMFTTQRKENFEIIQQIAKQYNPQSHAHLFTTDKKKLLIKEFQRYKNGKGYFDKIATIGWAIKQLGMEKQCKQLMKQFVQRIQNDQWYVNFDESIRAIEGFYDIIPEKKTIIYDKIERNMALTLWQNNQMYYQRITTALVKAGRFDSLLWETVENYCLRNLSMQYHPLTAINILLNFARANQGSVMFYDSMMRVFYKGGHLFQMNPLLILVHHSYDSSVVSEIIEAFGRASLKYKQLQILPQFKSYVHRLFFQSQFKLQQLPHVCTMLKYSRALGFSQQQIAQIDMKVLSKLPQITRIWKPLQIIQFYQTMAQIGIKLSPSVIDYLGYLYLFCLNNAKTNPHLYIRVYNYLKDNNLQGSSPMQHFLIDWMNQHSNIFDSSELKLIMIWARNEKLAIESKGGKLKIQNTQQAKKQIE